MQPSERDGAVIEVMAEFGQLSTSHVRELVFADGWRTSVARSIARLREGDYIRHVGQLPTGRAGSSPFVYQVGPEGWAYLNKAGAFKEHKDVIKHMVGVADLIAELSRADREGRLKLLVPDGLRLEVPFGDGDERADAWVKLAFPARGKMAEFYIEYERTKKAKNYIEAKLDAYVEAARALYARDPAAVFPFVVFVVTKERERAQVQKIVNSYGDDAEPFSVVRKHEWLDWLIEGRY